MTKQPQRPTAKIYQFPTPSRQPSGSKRFTSRPTLQQTAASFPTAPCNGSWYHGEAIEQAEQACDWQHQQH